MQETAGNCRPSLRIFSAFYLLPCRAKMNLQGETNLGNVYFMLVLKGILRGSLKITLQTKNNLQGKNNLKKDSLGYMLKSRELFSELLLTWSCCQSPTGPPTPQPLPSQNNAPTPNPTTPPPPPSSPSTLMDANRRK